MNTRVLNWMTNRFDSLHTVYETVCESLEREGITLRYLNFQDFCSCLARFDFDSPRTPLGRTGGRELITDFLDLRKENLVDSVLGEDVDPLDTEAEAGCVDDEEDESECEG